MKTPSRPKWTSSLIRPFRVVVVLVASGSMLLIGPADLVPASSSGTGSVQVRAPLFAAAFVSNGGQRDPAVHFELRGSGSSLFVTSEGLVLATRSGTLRLTFRGANKNPRVTGVHRLPGVVNYFRGKTPSAWQRGLPTYAAVHYRSLYPGIGLRYDVDASSSMPRVHATYTLAPRADPERILWRYDGARRAATAGLVDPAPTAWQEVDGHRVPVSVRYRIVDARTVGFAVGRYDRSRSLFIGPAATRVLAATAASAGYSTFLGGSKWDEAYDVKVDAAGEAYVVGFTFSPDFPTANARQGAFAGVLDAFVTKLSADGSKLLFSTFLGGTKTDIGAGVAVDNAGNAYVAGRTESTDFPTTAGAFQTTLRGHECQRPPDHEDAVPCHDAFVAKLSASGGLVYSTYFGGSRDEEALSIAVDKKGAAYFTGNTGSSDLPTKAPVQPKFAPVPCVAQAPCPTDAFVTKLNPEGSALVFSTYLGGKLSERVSGIAVDPSGSAYVAGTTRSTDFPTKNAQQSKIGGTGTECGPPPVQCADAFVTKFRPSGRKLVYSTYLGGSKSDGGGGITADARGNAYVTGATASADFPTLHPIQAKLDNAACSPAPIGPELCDDVFVTKFADRGTIVYSTYLSGRADDQGLGVAVDDAGGAYVTGSTSSTNFRTEKPSQAKFGGYIDGFLTKLTADGSAIDFSTFIGGSKADRGSGVTVDKSGNAYVTGRTISPDFPTTPGAFQPALRGDIDAFVTKVDK